MQYVFAYVVRDHLYTQCVFTACYVCVLCSEQLRCPLALLNPYEFHACRRMEFLSFKHLADVWVSIFQVKCTVNVPGANRYGSIPCQSSLLDLVAQVPADSVRVSGWQLRRS